MHSCQANPVLRLWQSSSCLFSKQQLIYPIFISHNDDDNYEIASLPGQYRVGLNHLQKYLEPSIEIGLSTVLVFGVIPKELKNPKGDFALDQNAPAIRAIKHLRSWFPNLTIAADVCLCSYTDHGHCGLITVSGEINNASSCEQLAKLSLEYARAGAHIVAPSDMMDGRVAAIKSKLSSNGYSNTVIMSYSAKFASCFYGPFRDACESKPGISDRKCYQLPPGGAGLALRAVQRDISEGADIIMVKPGLPYLDIVKEVKLRHPDHALAVYHVSGEYAMLIHAANSGAFDLETASLELLTCLRRAGASIIITYLTPYLLKLDFNKFCS